MKIIKKENSNHYSLLTKQINSESLSVLSSSLARIVLQTLATTPMYPKQLAKYLNIHEQNVYYTIKKLKEEELIEVDREETINGTIARYFKATAPSFFFSFKPFEQTPKVSLDHAQFLSPFIENGELNATIVVGSPDPHGPQKARSRDGYFGMDLALFLGTYLNGVSQSKVLLDTQVDTSFIENNNLILLGGPIVNKVTAQITHKTQPIYYDEQRKCIVSSISGKTYFDEACGMITQFKNPFNENKAILLLAGIRNAGTKAAILAFLKYFERIQQGNSYNSQKYCNVVEGLDSNSNGRVEDCEFLE